jgi:hypothetical protein
MLLHQSQHEPAVYTSPPIPCGFHRDSMESMRTPLGGKTEILGFFMNFPAAFMESTGVLMESMDSTWIGICTIVSRIDDISGILPELEVFTLSHTFHVESRHFTWMLPGFQPFSRYFLKILFGREPQPNHTWSAPGFDLDFQVYCLHNTWKFQ